MQRSQKTSQSRLQPATLSVDEAGAYIGISKTAMYRLLKQGDLPRVKLGRRTVIAVADLEKLIRDAKKTACVASCAKAGQ